MIKNPKRLKEMEDVYAAGGGGLSHKQALRLLTAMWREARALGVLPGGNPLDGIEADIRMAGILNSCLKNSSPK